MTIDMVAESGRHVQRASARPLLAFPASMTYDADMTGGAIAALVGDFYHGAEPMMDALRNAAGALETEISFFTEPRDVPWDSLHGFRALVIGRENKIAPRTSDEAWAEARHEEAVAEFVRRGGALVALHSGLASYPFDGPYFRTVRGGFLFHPSEHPLFDVKPLPVEHPVVEGFQGLSIVDEMYFVRIASAETEPLLQASSPDYGSSWAAWAHSIGKGRVFCLTPGHRPEVLSHPEYGRLLANGIKWALRL
jgi:hypothetical protein